MKKLFAFLLLSAIVLGCSKDENEPSPTNENGFTLNGKFYPTPYGAYANTGEGTPNDYSFYFMDQKISNNAGGTIDVDLANTRINAIVFGDLTLREKDKFVDEFFLDRTETLLGGIDDVQYFAEQLMDGNEDPLGPPDAFPAKSASVKILSKSGNNFEIEYDMVFKNDAHVTGYYKGELLLTDI